MIVWTFMNYIGFLFAAVTSYHKRSDSKSTDLLSYSSGGQQAKMGLRALRSECWQGCIPSGGSGGEWFLRPFWVLEAAHIPWLRASPPSSKPATGTPAFLGSHHNNSVCCHFSFSDSVSNFCLPLPFLRTFVITLGSQGVDNPVQLLCAELDILATLIPSVILIPLCYVLYHVEWFQGSRYGHIERGVILPATHFWNPSPHRWLRPLLFAFWH